MTTLYGFPKEWHQGMIQQTMQSLPPDTPSSARAVTLGILMAGAMIATSIDDAFSPKNDNSQENLYTAVAYLSVAVADIAETLESLPRQK